MPWTRIDPVNMPLNDDAILAAIDDTTASAAIEAKSDHPGWENRTGTAEGSIHMVPAERVTASIYRGLFGSFDVFYFIFLELGHHVLSRRGFQYQGGSPEQAFGRFVPGDHTLRRAADKTFPHLGAHLRVHSNRLVERMSQ